jgi:hypothetical protein
MIVLGIETSMCPAARCARNGWVPVIVHTDRCGLDQMEELPRHHIKRTSEDALSYACRCIWQRQRRHNERMRRVSLHSGR